jgi:hypothetical protein
MKDKLFFYKKETYICDCGFIKKIETDYKIEKNNNLLKCPVCNSTFKEKKNE